MVSDAEVVFQRARRRHCWENIKLHITNVSLLVGAGDSNSGAKRSFLTFLFVCFNVTVCNKHCLNDFRVSEDSIASIVIHKTLVCSDNTNTTLTQGKLSIKSKRYNVLNWNKKKRKNKDRTNKGNLPQRNMSFLVLPLWCFMNTILQRHTEKKSFKNNNNCNCSTIPRYVE